MSMSVVELFFRCPKAKCRHEWEREFYKAVNDNCPKCGAKDINPIDVKRWPLK